ncbi:peptidase S8 and S53, subtilisin, kexin, sedolisin [Azospirillum cavernae]|uniref:Peptidase S8 and S53, subtilisin, kexin, sedolisin n=1 Tax=Azospirillum cavernae TaxID=2320860 RepID=A0A418W5S5_9PROT|nr:S8 family peptidase [Azospirillum cavernae]RJF85288.1 peptidase S8 and S53, subtilisin, kexin, sedolisin [Azospirillum cavernae]
MSNKRNFLLGKGERLTEPVIVRTGNPDKQAPYTFFQAQSRLTPMLSAAVRSLDALPEKACPHDHAVMRMTLHPEYIAKSYFPGKLLTAVGLRAVGSRPRRILPAARSKGREPEEALTTELFVAGSRRAFRDWSTSIPDWWAGSSGADELTAIEQLSAPEPAEKLKSITSESEEIVFEVALHGGGSMVDSFVLEGFVDYVHGLGFKPDLDHRITSSGVSFVPVSASRKQAEYLAAYSFVRAVREMPKLRLLRPPFRSSSIPSTPSIALPKGPPIDPSIKAAIFDGGLPHDHPVSAWATAIEPSGIGPAEDDYLEHGLNVTSAALFGHITPGLPLPLPYARVDHYRVLDGDLNQNPLELYETLQRIQDALASKRYDFINFSIGPELPVEDDEIHAWTAVLDEYLSDGETLATIAVGNGGERDADNGYNRIQVPADCVNALSIGAADSRSSAWKRAPYSSIGPGRSPGRVKPSLVSFGGSIAEPYLVLGPGSVPTLMPTGGTSFAAPDTMRMGMGIRAHFGDSLRGLAINALLVHTSTPSGYPRTEVGWGRVARDLEEIVVCAPGVVRVVYQGEISASKYIRAQIPVPADQLSGMVEISATICYASTVDPHHPSNYTRAGLEVLFRPNKDKIDGESIHPKTTSFFKQGKLYATEDELRRDAHKWDNCLHHTQSFRGKSLKDPVFDIHYNARAGGQDFRPAEKLRYALIVTVKAPRVPDIYDQVVRRYRTTLEQLAPVIDIPVRL